MANTSILAAFERMWSYITVALNNKSDTTHLHDDTYYTKSEIDEKIDDAGSQVQIITWEADD